MSYGQKILFAASKGWVKPLSRQQRCKFDFSVQAMENYKPNALFAIEKSCFHL